MKTIALASALALTMSACGSADGAGDLPDDPDAPVIQVTSEGGFAPVEMILGNGPRYTLLADGRLIHQGPVIAIYPGPLLPNYQVTTVGGDDIERVLDLVEEIGLPEFDERLDDSQTSMVADATTEVVTYFDENGEHRYAVYALGLDPDPSNPSTAAFAELVGLLGDLASHSQSSDYQPDRVRVIAGPGGQVDEEFEDIRDWPLEDTDLSDWETLPNDWRCAVYEPGILEAFTDATQTTTWRNPGTSVDGDRVKLLVRPLHPGEPDCPGS